MYNQVQKTIGDFIEFVSVLVKRNSENLRNNQLQDLYLELIGYINFIDMVIHGHSNSFEKNYQKINLISDQDQRIWNSLPPPGITVVMIIKDDLKFEASFKR